MTKSWRKPLLITLSFSLIYEIAFAGAVLLAPDWALQQSGLPVNQETLFLGFGLGWCLVAIALFCALALKLVLENDTNGYLLTDILGYWWVVVGLAMYFKWGRMDNLIMDALKGAVLLVCNYKARKGANPPFKTGLFD
ncbi:MAG TPA: hypothetical protein VNJ01_12905 [Bacteriovoracaceae bacterium]|nr:hypothetical protein [Bacteriovoracaceae bacterium]